MNGADGAPAPPPSREAADAPSAPPTRPRVADGSDPLTGLPTRPKLVSAIRAALPMSGAMSAPRSGQRSGLRPGQADQSRQAALVVVDVDRFRVVNDSLGLDAGDSLLLDVARRLEAFSSPTVTLARCGGDEFAFLVEGECDVRDFAALVLARFEAPFWVAEEEVFVSVGAGLVESFAGYTRADEVLRDAETAVSSAKAAGRGQVAAYTPSMRLKALSQLRLETDLRHALSRGELRAHYQPIVSLDADETVSGVEALVRWQHPQRGLVLPSEFISIAEETGLIVPIGLWVLREACRCMQGWRQRTPGFETMTLSVNLSSVQVADPALVDQVVEVLAETGTRPELVRFEVTESAVMGANDATSQLRRLKALDVNVDIDDFGTGYSSLSRLHHLPVDTLKIDRSFIERLGVDADQAGFVDTIVRLAHGRGLDVIAEGVETAEQLDVLRELGCEKGQGFLFSKPVSEPGEALLARRVG